jgi:serine protease Do
MDIALLAFAEGQRPFSQGLSFLTRAVQEGENVLSAGFPRLGTAMIWQLGAGIVSNALVRLPVDDETDKTIGPYIQHTAQVDPGNSGGPLLIQTPGVPSGYSVVGINTLSAIRRQGTNFSIPMNRVRSFLDASLRPAAGEDLTRLDTRLDAFIEGLGLPKAVYPHIAGYLSNACTGENVEYAYREFLSKGTRPQWENITNRDTVEAMSYFVAWLIENNLRSRGTISITKESVTPMDNGRYKVTFNVNNKPMDSEWVNEYGIWRIRTFGGFAAGDKTFVEKKTKEDANTEKLRTDPSFQFAAGYTQIVERGRALGLEFLGRSGYVGYGFSFYYSGELFQIDTVTGVYFPIKAGPVAFTPFLDLGLALQFKPKSGGNEFNLPIDFGLCFKPGLQFTTAAVPGLYLQFAYQYNLLLNTLVDALAGDTVSGGYPDEHFFSVSIGYSFSF